VSESITSRTRRYLSVLLGVPVAFLAGVGLSALAAKDDRDGPPSGCEQPAPLVFTEMTASRTVNGQATKVPIRRVKVHDGTAVHTPLHNEVAPSPSNLHIWLTINRQKVLVVVPNN
jgi:hypothetical protein